MCKLKSMIGGKVIYQSGDFKLVSVESGKTIGES